MRRILIATLALATPGAGAFAQAGPDAVGVPGPLLSAEISQSFTADSNFNLDDPSPGTSYFADTRLLLGLANATPVQTFALGLDTGLRALWQADEDFDFTFASPSTATLDYGRDWASGGIDTFLNYRQRDVDSTQFIDDGIDIDNPDDPAVIDQREVQRDAIERRLNGGFGLEIATDAPSSYVLNFAGTRIDYDEEANDLTPRTTLAGDAAWILQINPVVSGTLGAAYSYFDAENTAETQIRQGQIDAGVIYAPSEILELNLGLGYANYIREQRVGGERQTLSDESGYVLRGGLEYLFEEVTVTADARLTNAAPETRLSGSVLAIYPLPRGLLRGRVFQRYGGGDTGQEIRVSGAGIGLTREINEVSNVRFDFGVARQENLDTTEGDIERFNFTAAYSYDITEVVSANIGYRFRSRDQGQGRSDNQGAESATSNAVFVELGRTFETRP